MSIYQTGFLYAMLVALVLGVGFLVIRDESYQTAFAHCTVEKLGDSQYCGYWAKVNFSKF